MSCFSSPKENDIENSHYESVNDISEYFNVKNSKTMENEFSVLDCKSIINAIPCDIFNIFSFSINVFTCEEVTLSTCESTYVKTNIVIKPYFPLNVSITFQGIVNGLSFRSSNQTLIPLQEENLYVRIQNYNKITQTIPKNMPVGKIVIISKKHFD
jgi:hypothetical protein